MQGQINTPVADQLMKNIPDQAAGGYQTEVRAAEIERQELNQLMSVEMQLSPVRKQRSGANTHDHLPHLNQSMKTSQMTPPLSIV